MKKKANNLEYLNVSMLVSAYFFLKKIIFWSSQYLELLHFHDKECYVTTAPLGVEQSRKIETFDHSLQDPKNWIP